MSPHARIVDRLPSCNARTVSFGEDMVSVSQHLINRSAHRAALDAASLLHAGQDPDAPLPGGVSLAAEAALHRNTCSNGSSTVRGRTDGQNTLGAVSRAASPPTDEAASSDDADGRAIEPSPRVGVSPRVAGTRHVFKIPPIAEGDIVVDGAAESHPMPRSAMMEISNSDPDVAGGTCQSRKQRLKQEDCAGSSFRDDPASGGNDHELHSTEAILLAPAAPAAAAAAVAAAAKALTGAGEWDGEAAVLPAERAQRYMAELLQLRGVVEELGEHLDSMIASTESSISGSSRPSSGKSHFGDVYGKSHFSDDVNTKLPNAHATTAPVDATTPNIVPPAEATMPISEATEVP